MVAEDQTTAIILIKRINPEKKALRMNVVPRQLPASDHLGCPVGLTTLLSRNPLIGQVLIIRDVSLVNTQTHNVSHQHAYSTRAWSRPGLDSTRAGLVPFGTGTIITALCTRRRGPSRAARTPTPRVKSKQIVGEPHSQNHQNYLRGSNYDSVLSHSAHRMLPLEAPYS